MALLSCRSHLLLLVLLAGCPQAVVPAPEDAGAAAALAVDAGPPPLPPLTFQLVATFLDGGRSRLDDAFDAGMTLEPAGALELTSPLGLAGVRVRLLDWTDAVVPSDDLLETSDGGFRYRLELTQPLKSGRTYSLLVDGESADAFSDVFGRDHEPWRVPLRVLGDPEPEAGQASKKTKKKRR
jgi:hypothetical protein